MFCLHSAAAIIAALPKLAQAKSWSAVGGQLSLKLDKIDLNYAIKILN